MNAIHPLTVSYLEKTKSITVFRLLKDVVMESLIDIAPPCAEKKIWDKQRQVVSQDDDWIMVTALQQVNQLLLQSLKLFTPLFNMKKICSILVKAPNLHTLHIQNFISEDLNPLLHTLGENCQELQSLYLSDLDEVKTMDLRYLRRCKKLKELHLYSFHGDMENSLVELLAQVGGELRLLVLNSCSQVSSKSLLAMIKYCPHLKILNLAKTPLIAAEHLSYLNGEFCPITSLHLEGIHLKKSHFSNNPRLFGRLVELSLRASRDASEILESLGAVGTSLQKLDLSRCEEISFAAIEKYLSQKPNLQFLIMQECSLQKEEVEQLSFKFPSTKIYA